MHGIGRDGNYLMGYRGATMAAEPATARESVGSMEVRAFIWSSVVKECPFSYWLWCSGYKSTVCASQRPLNSSLATAAYLESIMVGKVFTKCSVRESIVSRIQHGHHMDYPATSKTPC